MKLEKRKIKMNELFSQGPISKSLSIENLRKLRENLIQINKSFNRYGEIPPHELIKFLIKNLHIENNKDRINSYSKIFNLSYEKDNLNEYLKAYTDFFDSVISNKNKGFFGTYQYENICSSCKNKFEYYESFYYITLDFDDKKMDKKEIKISDYLEHNNDDAIKVYKYCPNCKKATEQKEIKSIYKCPCRLVILIKNNSKTVSLMHTQIFNFKQKFNNVTLHYNLVNTINYNERKKKYEYSFYKILKNEETENTEQSWEHPTNNNISVLNTENIVALFYLYMGDNANFDNANEIKVKSSQNNNYLFSTV
jgi:DNA-directed RNA polymerase subunit RPC12/RpoP